MVCTLIDQRNDAIKCSKLGSETTGLLLVVALEFEHFVASKKNMVDLLNIWLVFFVFKSLLGIKRQRNIGKFAVLS